MTERIGLEAVLVDQQFQAGLQRYMSGIDEMIAGTEKATAASDGLAEGAGAAGDALGGAGEEAEGAGDDAVGLAAKIEIAEKAFDQLRSVIETGLELAELGAQATRVERRFAAFAEQAGGAEAILEAFQEGAGGAASKMDAMASASRLLQMGLVTNADEMQLVVELATRLGDQTASVTDRIGDFSLLLSNTSIPRLDNFGIKSSNVRARIAELQASIAGLSREEAFRMAVFEEGGKSLSVLGDRVDDEAAAFERAQAKLADFRVEMGQKLAPVASKLVDLFASLESGTLALIAGLGGAIGIAAKFSGGLGGLATKLGTTTAGLGLATAAVVAWIVAFEMAQDVAKKIDEGMEQSADAIDTWSGEAAAMIAEGSDLAGVMDLLTQRVDGTSEAFERGGVLADIFVNQQQIMGQAASEINQIVLANTSSWGEYVSIIDAYNATVTDAGARIEALSESQYELRQSSADAANAILGMARDTAMAVDETMRLADAQAQSLLPAAASSDQAMLGFVQAVEAGVVVAGGHEAALRLEYAALQDEALAADAAAASAERLRDRQRDAAAAAQEHTLAILDQAQTLKDAEPARIAQAAIEGLKEQLAAGRISVDEYEDAVRRVQDRYELVTPRSRFLSEALGMLDGALARGGIAADEYDDKLAEIIGVADQVEAGLLDLPNALKQVEDEFGRAGSAMVDNLRGGFVSSWGSFMDEYGGKLGELRGKLPGSEPADTSSPLYGLSRAGAAILENLRAGMDQAAPSVVARFAEVGGELGTALTGAIGGDVDALFGAAGVLGGLGSQAAGMLQRQVMGPLQDAIGGLDKEFEALTKDFGDLAGLEEAQQAALAALGGGAMLPTLLLLKASPKSHISAEQERLLDDFLRLNDMLAQAKATDEERAKLAEEYAIQQERILRLQEAQEKLRFLEQQSKLLDMIAEHGLDAADILGGLELGVEASLEGVIEAMTRAMEEIVARAEEELQIGSPSRVFKRLGEQAMQGMAMGIERMMSLPVRESTIATQRMIQAPAAIAAAGMGSQIIDNSRTVAIEAGGNTIANDVGLNRYTATIRREVERGIRGER